MSLMKKFLYFLISVFTIFQFNLFATPVQYDSIEILVGDRAITKVEIDLKSVEIAQSMRVGINESTIAQYRSQAVALLIEEALLENAADEKMIIVSEDDLDNELEAFLKQRRLNQSQFEELLEKQGLSLSDFRDIFRGQIKRNRVVMMEVRSKIKVDEEKLKADFEQNAGFDRLIHARHILFRLSSGASEDEASKIIGKAKVVKDRIERGESFEELAVLYSEDPSVKRNKGDLGFFRKTDMVREFSEAAFSLKVGEISEPVRTPFGYHLIQVIEEKKQATKSFDEEREKLMNQNYKEQYEVMYKQYIETLKSKSRITYKQKAN